MVNKQEYILTEKEFPILEFDEDRNAFIRPVNLIKPIDIPEKCVLCFFSEAIEKFVNEFPHKIITHFKTESRSFPVYEIYYKGEKLALLQAGVGAPILLSVFC